MTENGIEATRRWPTLVAGESSGPGNALEIAFICTGNRFRSPLAAALLEQTAGVGNLHVVSAGTLDLGPVAALPEAIDQGRRLGVDLSGHRARCARHLDLHAADLVLGFEQRHVAAAVVDAGAPRDRSFTLPELVDLLDARAEDARAGIERASAHRDRERGTSRPPEIADPLGKGEKVFRETADEIDDLVAKLAARLFPRS